MSPGRTLSGLVSVVTPARDSATLIERAIRSVAAQTVAPLEHIVVDDGSTDGTADIVERLRGEFPHVRYERQSWQGAAVARNRGIELARGRYIAFLDSDDCWGERKLEHQIAYMEDRGALFSYGDYTIRDPRTGGVIRVFRSPDRLGYEDFLNGCPIGCLTACYNQERLGKVYMPLVRRGQDWGLWLALTRGGTTAMRYPGNHAVYHVRGGSLSSNKLLKSLDVYRIYRREERKGPLESLWYLTRFSWPKILGKDWT